VFRIWLMETGGTSRPEGLGLGFRETSRGAEVLGTM
jgi:hypothetical protein